MGNFREKAMVAALVGALFAISVMFLTPRPATAEKVLGCAQWEVMLSEPTHASIDVKALPGVGKPLIEPSPPGWEPFAFGPTGQLVYRRCAK
jgi:hypothetical protein